MGADRGIHIMTEEATRIDQGLEPLAVAGLLKKVFRLLLLLLLVPTEVVLGAIVGVCPVLPGGWGGSDINEACGTIHRQLFHLHMIKTHCATGIAKRILVARGAIIR